MKNAKHLGRQLMRGTKKQKQPVYGVGTKAQKGTTAAQTTPQRKMSSAAGGSTFPIPKPPKLPSILAYRPGQKKRKERQKVMKPHKKLKIQKRGTTWMTTWKSYYNWVMDSFKKERFSIQYVKHVALDWMMVRLYQILPFRRRGRQGARRRAFSSSKRKRQETVIGMEVGVSFLSKKPADKHAGEDAYFLASGDGFTAIGVADGVGGWNRLGVDPGQFSRKLMKHAEKHARNGTDNPSELLKHSYNDVQQDSDVKAGSSTACLAVLDHREKVLKTANLGDSQYLIIRNGEEFYMSKEQTHFFNCPFQLAKYPGGRVRDGGISDSPEKAYTENHELQENDIVVLGTDGLFDNLFPKEIVEIVEKFKEEDPNEISHQLRAEAKQAAQSPKRHTPFAKYAEKGGHYWRGGKDDDICIVVGRVHFDQ